MEIAKYIILLTDIKFHRNQSNGL